MTSSVRALSLLLVSLGVGGCADPSVTLDAGHGADDASGDSLDASTVGSTDAPVPDDDAALDAFAAPDVFAEPDGSSSTDAFTPPDAFTSPDAFESVDAFLPADAYEASDAFAARVDLHVHIEVDNTCRMTVTPREASALPGQTLYFDWHDHSRDYPVDVWMSYGGGYTDLMPGATWDEPIGHCSTPFVGDEYADISTACSSFRFLIHCR